jgi:hypothetical protein
MNRDEHMLKRLLKSAGQSQRESSDEMPFTTEARILAGWRSAAPGEDWTGLAVFFRRAVICAVLVVVMSAGWSEFSNAREVPGAIALANLAQEIQIVPQN